MEAIQTYFEGEKRAGVYLIIIGTLILATAIYQFYFLKNEKSIFWITLIITSLLQIILGISLLFNSPRQSQNAKEEFSNNQLEFLQKENQRIDNTLITFHRIKITWYILMGFGVLFFLIPNQQNWMEVFLALGFLAFIMVFFDIAAEQRIITYQIYLKSISQLG